MSRIASVSSIKGVRVGVARNTIPREGTRLRAVYDLLAPGEIVPTSAIKALASNEYSYAMNCIRQLKDFYGLDIRRMGSKSWCRVGEWDGRAYIDHVAERVG